MYMRNSITVFVGINLFILFFIIMMYNFLGIICVGLVHLLSVIGKMMFMFNNFNMLLFIIFFIVGFNLRYSFFLSLVFFFSWILYE